MASQVSSPVLPVDNPPDTFKLLKPPDPDVVSASDEEARTLLERMNRCPCECKNIQFTA